LFPHSGAAGGGWLAETVRKTLSAVPRSWKQCCDKHDICYGTCNKAKSTCDSDMLKCMTTQVKLFSLKSTRTKDEDKCVKYKLDKVFYEAVHTLGCSPYKSAQEEACSCRKNIKLNYK
jgi:secretory phospholipase A2